MNIVYGWKYQKFFNATLSLSFEACVHEYFFIATYTYYIHTNWIWMRYLRARMYVNWVENQHKARPRKSWKTPWIQLPAKNWVQISLKFLFYYCNKVLEEYVCMCHIILDCVNCWKQILTEGLKLMTFFTPPTLCVSSLNGIKLIPILFSVTNLYT